MKNYTRKTWLSSPNPIKRTCTTCNGPKPRAVPDLSAYLKFERYITKSYRMFSLSILLQRDSLPSSGGSRRLCVFRADNQEAYCHCQGEPLRHRRSFALLSIRIYLRHDKQVAHLQLLKYFCIIDKVQTNCSLRVLKPEQTA